MNPNLLMVLLEIDDGSYHACMIGRGSNDYSHVKAEESLRVLISYGYVEWVGDELSLIQAGRDVLEAAVNGARREHAPNSM